MRAKGWSGGLTLALATAALGGCASAAVVPRTEPAVAAAEVRDADAQKRALDEEERSALEWVAAADPRFAKRLATPPSEAKLRTAAVKALAEGDADVSIRDGNLDFFSFQARGRAIAEAAKTIDGSREPPPDSPSADSSAPRPHLERELVERIVAEERARLEEERSLPGGASALVRGIVETWSPPSSPDAAKERDEWLGHRIDVIQSSLAGSKLPRGALFELDDALDPLERIAASGELPSSAKAIARLRVSLGDTAPASGGGGDYENSRRERMEERVRAHLGLLLSGTEIRARLERAEAALRAMAKEALGHGDERAVAKRAEDLTFSEANCDTSSAASRARSMAPPSERAAICGLLHFLRDAGDDTSRASALVALHDETVVALWALALHADGVTPDRAIAAAHPFFGAQPEREARLVRFAEARPVAAIGAGLAADFLTRTRNADDARATSGRWLSFGDAPLDIVERELSTSVPPPPASPRP